MKDNFDQGLINELAYKWLLGTITEEERAIYNKWTSSFDYTQLELPEGYAENPMVIRDRMHAHLFKNVAAQNKGKVFNLRAFWWKSVAAAVILVCGLFFYMKRNPAGPFKSNRVVASADIVPGRQSATLTLANGEKIVLSDVLKGELAGEAGLSITKTGDGELVYEIHTKGKAAENKINVLTTGKGETYRVRLPDGSLVALNAASSLTYSIALGKNGERRVELAGEGYFEVAKDKRHPFIVKTATQEIKVLGTHFNVNSYADEDIVRTTLLEGAVGVKTVREQKILKPGEQATVRNDKINIAKADLEAAVAWKNGEFIFTGESITEVMRVLSRWYNVEIEYRGAVTKERFEGSTLKGKNITEVLELLELTNAVHFKIEGRKIIVTK